MVLKQETFEKFGYSYDKLKHKSHRKVVCKCDISGKIYETQRAHVKDPLNTISPPEQRKITSLAKYGVANISQRPEIKKKKADTCLHKFGATNNLKTAENQQKVRATCQQLYGVEYPLQSKDIRAKRKATCLVRYGVEFTHQNQAIRQKALATTIARHGCAHPHNYGRAEQELRTWVEEISGKPFPSNYTLLGSKELDMYNAELKLAVEYCGLRWHHEGSPEPRDRNYHYNKYASCQKLGIRLITIFEDEWVHRQLQVKNFLKATLGCNSRRIFGRKCAVKDIDKKPAKEFLEEHHIQGAAHLSTNFAGLFYADELVGVMSFGKHHRKTSVVVLDRLCFKSDISVLGGADKLFRHLLQRAGKPASVISWSDNRWSCGGVYTKLGFVAKQTLAPDYSYVKNNCATRISKQSQKKSSSGCPENKTEKQWSAENGLHRIWDCGKIRWEFLSSKIDIPED